MKDFQLHDIETGRTQLQVLRTRAHDDRRFDECLRRNQRRVA